MLQRLSYERGEGSVLVTTKKIHSLYSEEDEALAQAAPSQGVPKARLDGSGGSLGWWEGSLAMAGGWNQVVI